VVMRRCVCVCVCACDILLLETSIDKKNVQKTKMKTKKGDRAGRYVVTNQA
jgi:hypothetical protein